MSNNSGREIAESAFNWGFLVGCILTVLTLWGFGQLVW